MAFTVKLPVTSACDLQYATSLFDILRRCEVSDKLPGHKNLTCWRKFPRSKEEQNRWLRSLPNVPTQKISEHVGICSKHFPPDCPTSILPGGSSRPSVPPSLFGATSPLFFAQTLQSTPRHVDERNVSSDARSPTTLGNSRMKWIKLNQDLIGDKSPATFDTFVG